MSVSNLDKDKITQSAVKTLSVEAFGLNALKDALQESMASALFEAVKIITECKGRVIVSGLGKSGHIGAKVAATLASTGTPAFFVHPSEANHGDLGMIDKSDVILALSWSGETAELKGIIHYSRRFNIPLISITSRPDSTLGRQSDVCLLLPRVEEACPNGLAPTTSTTMQLALGDALAVALLETRGFSAQDFRTYHPGGSLGAQLNYVRDIMHTEQSLPIVKTGTSVTDAIKVQAEKHFGCVVIVDQDNKLLGIVTDGDLARNLTRDLSKLTVDDIMTTTPKTVTPDTMAGAAIALINNHQISVLLVVEDNKPVGLIHFHDLLRIGAV